MDSLFLLGRILYGGFFLMAGLNHFRNAEMMAGYAASKGVPAPRLGVLGSGALIVFGGLSIAFGFHPRWGTIALTVFLVPTSFLMHNFWADTDPATASNNQIHFLKNLALLGAAWTLLSVPQPWPHSLN